MTDPTMQKQEATRLGLFPYNRQRNEWLLRWSNPWATEASYEECILKDKPTLERIKDLVLSWHDREIDRQILEDFRFEGAQVWLSPENQFNYKVAYDLAVQTKGASLPVVFKFGRGEEPIYREFKTLPDLQAFYLASVQYVQGVLSRGWQIKDQIKWQDYAQSLEEEG